MMSTRKRFVDRPYVNRLKKLGYRPESGHHRIVRPSASRPSVSGRHRATDTHPQRDGHELMTAPARRSGAGPSIVAGCGLVALLLGLFALQVVLTSRQTTPTPSNLAAATFRWTGWARVIKLMSDGTLSRPGNVLEQVGVCCPRSPMNASGALPLSRPLPLGGRGKQGVPVEALRLELAGAARS